MKKNDDMRTKHRLTSWNNGSATYHSNGNINTKSEAGTYRYTNFKPHAVDTIINPANNSLIHRPAQQITYNPFQKTATISEDGNTYSITYGTDGQRKKTVLKENNITTETRFYSGRYEKSTTSSGTKEYHYIPTPSGTVAAHIRTGGSGTTYFLLKDHLGSIMKVVTASGSTIEEHSYDAWGNHRNPANWNLADFVSALVIRGYTRHEMLPQFQLINMNGRMYDPVIGRVLSPDNFVVNPFNAQNYNRYSYALNNPLKFIDPSGHKWKWWQWTLLGMGLSDPATASATIATTGAGIAGIAGGAGITGYVTTASSIPIMGTADLFFTNYDGKNVAKNMLEKKRNISQVYLVENFNDKEIMSLINKQGIKYETRSKHDFSKFGISNHQGIVMEVEVNNTIHLNEIINQNYELIVMLDHLEDPQNMGAIIRTCVAAGVDSIIIPNKRTATLSGTVMKASAGTMIDIPICEVSNLHDAILKLKKENYWIIGSDMEGTDYKEVDYTGKIVIVIGNEGKGLSRLIKKECDFIASLPINNVESLNASVAAGIIIYEAISKRK